MKHPVEKRSKKIEQAYRFFVEAEEKQHLIRFADILSATGYSSATIRMYLATHWRQFLIPKEDGYLIKGLKQYTLQEFQNFQKQKQKAFLQSDQVTLQFPRPLLDWLLKQAIQEERSIDAIVIEALEYYQHAHVHYSEETDIP